MNENQIWWIYDTNLVKHRYIFRDGEAFRVHWNVSRHVEAHDLFACSSCGYAFRSWELKDKQFCKNHHPIKHSKNLP